MALDQVLTIAGSDSSGGAGIQADLKTFASLQTYGSSVVTALTAQNTLGVQAVEASSPDFVAKQLECNLSDLKIKSAKTGMLANAAVIQVVVDALKKEASRIPLVIDPVMVSTSGHTLLEESAIKTLKEGLLPLATVVTPNLSEGFILAGITKSGEPSLDQMKEVCRVIAKQGPPYVLLKGGHLPSEGILDVLYERKTDSFEVFRHARIDTKNTHGTGCTLSAAICSYVGQGVQTKKAIELGVDYVQAALHTAFPVGAGSGPVNHLHSVTMKSLPPTSPHKPTPFKDALISSCKADWEHYVWDNDFIQGLRKGTLPIADFLHFLKQDYVFLKHYARVFALAVFKSNTFEEMRAANDNVSVILREVKMHEQYCLRFGTEANELEREEMGTVAYTRFVLDVAHSKTLLHLRVATSPCSIGYAEIGRRLLEDPETVRGDKNPFWTWIEEYGSDWFQETVNEGMQRMEQMAQNEVFTEEQLYDMCRVFETATRMEAAFFKQSVAIEKALSTTVQ